MSLTATGLVTFPDQQKIIDYINGHPGKMALDTPVVQTTFPDGIQKIAAQFANKTMKHEEIKSNIETAMTIVNEETKKWTALKSGLSNLVTTLKANDQKQESKPSTFTQEMKMIHDKMAYTDTQNAIYTDMVSTFFQKILDDVLDNATFTPPLPNADGKWTRHVPPPLT
jgi:hypothetical protein